MWHMTFAIWAYVLVLVWNVAMLRSLVDQANIKSRREKMAPKGTKGAEF